ncbi:MAG: hypothetical protein HQM09_22140 [Candidatus Riflebacteria bacterium]|nr:hypothetical protein [Candidatus Riflebacteria bacterium]
MNKCSILFMDDHVNDKTAVAVIDAIEALKAEGYDVETAEKMSEAIDAFYRKFFKVFVLDIDMGDVRDILEGRGTKVADLYKSLDNNSLVIMYSAMGNANDAFLVANRHVFGYVCKAESNAIKKLVSIVQAAEKQESADFLIPESMDRGRVLVTLGKSPRLDKEKVTAAVKAAGSFETTFCSLDNLLKEVKKPDVVAGMVLTSEFETKESEMLKLEKLCSVQPAPQVILGCEARDELCPSIFSLINCHPFRLLDTFSDSLYQNITLAVKDAARLYGGRETFRAEPEYVRRVADKIDWKTLDESLMPSSEDLLDETSRDFQKEE